MAWWTHLKVAWFLLRHAKHEVRAYWATNKPETLHEPHHYLNVGYKCLPCTKSNRLSGLVFIVRGMAP